MYQYNWDNFRLHFFIYIKLSNSMETYHPDQPEWEAFGNFYLKLNMLLSIIQSSLNLLMCLFNIFSLKTYMPTKSILNKG